MKKVHIAFLIGDVIIFNIVNQACITVCFWVLAKGLMGERKMGEILLCLIFAPTAYLVLFRMHEKKPAISFDEIAGFAFFA